MKHERKWEREAAEGNGMRSERRSRRGKREREMGWEVREEAGEEARGGVGLKSGGGSGMR